MNKNDKIYIAGHTGLVGSAIVRRLMKDGYTNILVRDHSALDLTDQQSVRAFFEKERPDYVFLAAAKGGGIFANNTYRAEFMYENMMIECNVIHQSFLSEVKKLVFFGTADVYPKNCPQPMKEEYLLTDPLEPTCEPFAIAKIAGIKMCESYNRQYGTDFIVVIPPNVYGPNQHYDIMNAQVLPSLVKKFHDAKSEQSKEVVIWGTGSPVRDFLFVDDVVDACLFLMNEHARGDYYFNIGTGRGCTILELAGAVKNEVGYEGQIVFDSSKPDGTPKKLLDISRIKGLGWSHKIGLDDGIQLTYGAFLKELEKKEVRTSMICRIGVGEKDMASFAERAGKQTRTSEQPGTYKNRVVIKPWGYEFLVFENELVAAWLLHIKKGFSTSMHCHPEKKTSLILLSGNAMSNTLLHRNYLKGGDAIILDKKVFHSTKALSDDGILLLEIESPPIKTDLLRLDDRYGRERAGYEGITEMETRDLKDYDYFCFEEPDSYERHSYTGGRFGVSFEVFMDDEELQRNFRAKVGELYTSCRGRLLDRDGNALLETGDTQKGEILSNINGINISGKTVLLRTTTKDR